TIRFVSHKASNRLIVTAPREKMAEIKTMIESLDAPKPMDVAVRVVPLKHVNAKDLVQEIGPLYQKVRGEALKDSIEIAANSRSNSIIVLSSEANYKEITKMIRELDTEEAQEQAIKAFPLKNADAEDVAQQLTELHQSSDEDSYSRYWYYGR